jgi:hypothetical protein
VTGRLNFWLLILTGVCALSLWFGKDLMLKGGGGSAEKGPLPEEPVDFSLAAEEMSIHLMVLNGTAEPGLAHQISLLLGRAGCVAENVGNAPRRDFEHSLLVNRRLTDQRASDLARRLGGIRVIREWDSRAGEDAVLVLGADHDQLKTNLAAVRPTGGK